MFYAIGMVCIACLGSFAEALHMEDSLSVLLARITLAVVLAISK